MEQMGDKNEPALSAEPGKAYFRVGLYRHYKGGVYTALGIVTHHEGWPMVRYVSHTYGGEWARPLFGREGDSDGFLDPVSLPTGARVDRFVFIGEPNDTPIADR